VNSKKSLPGLATLSSYQKMDEHRNIKTISTAGVSWPELFEKENQVKLSVMILELDSWMTQHIQTFYNSYELELPFKFEHKTNHLSKRLFYFNKCDYALLTLEDKILFKFRGKKESENCAIFGIATEILKPSDQIVGDLSFRLEYNEQYIQGGSQYLVEKRINPSAILPGYMVSRTTSFRFGNTYMSVRNVATHKFLRSKRGYFDWANRFCIEDINHEKNKSEEMKLTLLELMTLIQKEKNDFYEDMNNNPKFLDKKERKLRKEKEKKERKK
jgi:hypothetical protein